MDGFSVNAVDEDIKNKYVVIRQKMIDEMALHKHDLESKPEELQKFKELVRFIEANNS